MDRELLKNIRNIRDTMALNGDIIALGKTIEQLQHYESALKDVCSCAGVDISEVKQQFNIGFYDDDNKYLSRSI